MDNVVLVPEREFSEFKNWKSNRGGVVGGSIVQAVRNPEQREMVKKFHAAQEIFNDSSKPYELRKAQYDETMRDFHTLKNKISGFRANSSIPATKQADDKDDKEKSVDDVVDLMPDSLKSNARNLMRRIQKNTNENLISWSPTNGEVSIRGRRLEGSNIADLVGDVMRSSSSKSLTKRENPNRVAFIDALVEMNAPETLIKNRDALKQFRQMKENYLPPPAKRTKAIGHHQPPGIPEHILKESDYDDDDDNDDFDGANEKLYRDTNLKKSDASPIKNVKKAIQWANTK